MRLELDWRCSLIATVVVLTASLSAERSRADERDGAIGNAAVAELVSQLGDERYPVRERAATELLRRGLDVVPELEQGCKHVDREVRYRCERLLVVLRDREQGRRLDAFLHNYDPKRSYNFPGWQRFRQQFGDATPARSLYADMYSAEPDLLAAIDRGPKAVSEALPTRGAAMQQMLQANQELTVGSIATLLFATGDEQVAIQIQFGFTVAQQFLTQASFGNAITSGGNKELLRKLLTGWLLRKEEWLLMYNMPLALRFEMKETIIVLVDRSLRGTSTNSSARQLAIRTVVKLKDETRLPLLEKCLEDKTVYTNWSINNLMIQTQVRDVALAGLLVMHKQDPKEFGFERIQLDAQEVFQPYSVGFETDDKRSVAFGKWQDFRIAQKKNAG